MPAAFVSGPLRVPKYRRHKPSNQAVVTLGGKDIYLGKWRSAASQEKYRRLIAEWLQTGSTPSTSGDELTTVELIVAYLYHAQSYYRKHARVTAEARLIADALRIVKRLYGRTSAADFGPVAYKAVRQEMVNAGWVRKHINKQCDRIKRMFKWAAGEELVPASIYETLRELESKGYEEWNEEHVELAGRLLETLQELESKGYGFWNEDDVELAEEFAATLRDVEDRGYGYWEEDDVERAANFAADLRAIEEMGEEATPERMKEVAEFVENLRRM